MLSERVTSRRWTTLRASASVLAGRRTLAIRVAGTRCRRALRVDRHQRRRRHGRADDLDPVPHDDLAVAAERDDRHLGRRPDVRRRPLRDAATGRRRAARQGPAGGLLPERRLVRARDAPTPTGFPPEVLGEPLDGFPDERWLDVRRLDVLGPLLEARMDLCAREGLRRRRGRQRRRLRQPHAASRSPPTTSCASTASWPPRRTRAGSRSALKNDLDQVAALEPDFDWALNEQCFQYDECERAEAVRRRGQGGVRGRVRARARGVLRAGPGARATWRCSSASSSGHTAGRAGDRAERRHEARVQRRARLPAEQLRRAAAGPGRSGGPRPAAPARSAGAAGAPPRGPARSPHAPSPRCSGRSTRLRARGDERLDDVADVDEVARLAAVAEDGRRRRPSAAARRTARSRRPRPAGPGAGRRRSRAARRRSTARARSA